MTRIVGFAPIVGASSRVLILGSMPSAASLEKQQYYGKPQNAFWRIMGELFGAGPDLRYEERTEMLARQGVAVWDVLAACERPGSLDSAIKMQTIEANDFATLLGDQPAISHIFFNGKKAEEIFRKRSLAAVARVRPDAVFTCLPSTSPAMASLRFEEKLHQWRAVLLAVNGEVGLLSQPHKNV
jgi:TDG/mug DNA glycosylase family protein